jgi:hypothetical protein
MDFDYVAFEERAKLLPAIFMSRFVITPTTGIEQDYTNVFSSISSLYFAVRDSHAYEVGSYGQRARGNFSAHISSMETYVNYLERRLDFFNQWCEDKTDNLVEISKKRKTRDLVRRGYLDEVRAVIWEEAMDVLYHEQARELNRSIRGIKKFGNDALHAGITFEDFDHRKLVGMIADAMDLCCGASNNMWKDNERGIDPFLEKYDLV